MFYFIFRARFFHGRQTISASQSFNLLHSLQPDLSIIKPSPSRRFFCSISPNENSFTVSYLIKKCGFSPELASRASNYVSFEIPEKPDSLIAFLENHGFSESQIASLVKRQPTLLVSNTEKTLLPKFEFLYSIGFSKPELAKMLSIYPKLLKSSLKNQIIPSFNLLRGLVPSDDLAVKAVKRFPIMLVYDLESYLYPNINILRENGVLESSILTHLINKPRTLMFNTDRLKEIVEEVKRMGFDSSTNKFLQTAVALKAITKPTLEKKFDAFRRWGLSDQEIHEAFRRYPSCMLVSEDKIMAIMNFLVNKMGYSSTHVAQQSSIFSRSLDKKIVPRALFVQELLSRGLVDNVNFSMVFDSSEKEFLRRYVNRYINTEPNLLKLYREKFNISGKKLRSEVA